MKLVFQRLHNRGGKGGICPPWNFQIKVISPLLPPPPEIEIRAFFHCYSTLPPMDSNPYASTVRYQYKLYRVTKSIWDKDQHWLLLKNPQFFSNNHETFIVNMQSRKKITLTKFHDFWWKNCKIFISSQFWTLSFFDCGTLYQYSMVQQSYR